MNLDEPVGEDTAHLPGEVLLVVHVLGVGLALFLWKKQGDERLSPTCHAIGHITTTEANNEPPPTTKQANSIPIQAEHEARMRR